MNIQKNKSRYRSGFTIVELIVVIVIIGILAGISIVSYGSWRHSATAAKVKSDLNGVIAAMDSYRTYNNVYSTTVPSSVVASSGVVLVGGSTDGSTYCVDGTSTDDATITYYVASESKAQGPLSGTCATRPGLPVPSTPTNLAMTSVSGTHVTLSWTAAANAVTYTAQCASDFAYIIGMQATTVTAPTVTVTVNGLTPSSAYYCRVNASNANGTSGWVSQSSGTNTTNNYGALAVATSIDGYWTTAPQGFLLEDGAAVSRTTYSDLFNVIGTTYGAGDGTLTFNLPDSRGRVAVNLNPSDAEFNTIGEKYGAKTEQLSIAEMPSHTHIQNPHDHNGGLANPYVVATNAFGGVAVTSASGAVFGFRYSTAPAATATNQYTGGNTAHNIIQPSIVATSAIKYTLSDTSGVSYPAATSIQGYWSLAPTEYLLEDGSAVSRATYSALFAAIGTTYGAGDGSTTFNLPDSRGRVAVNLNPSDAEFNSIGKKYGEKTHLLSSLEMPSHTHIQNPHDHNGGFANPYVTDGSWGLVSTPTQAGSYYGFVLAKSPATTATNQNTGGGTAHNVIQPSITKLMAIKYTASTGTINPVATGTSVTGYWSSAPTGYLAQDGSAVSRTTYAALFAAIGTTYGAGDGSTTFNLPDSRGRVAVNLNPSDAEFNSIGKKYGEKTHVLSIAELPSHTHIQNPHDHNAGLSNSYVNDSSFGGLAATSANASDYGFYLAKAPSATATNQNTGGGQAFNVIQPSIVKMFVVKY